MVLRAYLDASKTEPIGITCVAGHVGNADAWDAFEPQWKAALDYWNLETFHLTDLVGIMGRERATLCIRNFAQVMRASNLEGIFAGARDADWDAMVAANNADTAEYLADFLTRYHAVLDMALGRLSMEIGLNLPDEDTLVVLDTDHVPTDATVAVFNRWQAKNPRLVGLAITFATKSLPLQAADLFAGLRRRDWAVRGLDGEPSATEQVVNLDMKTIWNAGGKRSFGSLWSAEIAQKIAGIKARAASPSSPKDSEEG